MRHRPRDRRRRNQHRDHNPLPGNQQPNFLYNALHKVLDIVSGIEPRRYANIAYTVISNSAYGAVIASHNFATNTVYPQAAHYTGIAYTAISNSAYGAVIASRNFATNTVYPQAAHYTGIAYTAISDSAYNKARAVRTFITESITPSNLASISWKAPYKCTSFMYSTIDSLFPMYDEYGEFSAINANLKFVTTAAILMVASTPWVSIMALGYNYTATTDNLAENLLGSELRALGNGDVPTTQHIESSQHWRNFLCSFGALAFCGIPGLIVAGRINTYFQNKPDIQRQQETEHLINEADTREHDANTRLKASPDYNGLPPQVRAVIATQIVPALAEFSHRNDNRKQLEFVYASAHLLKSTLAKHNIIVPNNATVSALLSAVCSDNNVYVANISNHVRNNNGFTSAGAAAALNAAELQTVEQLTNTFASRVEKITAARGRG